MKANGKGNKAMDKTDHRGRSQKQFTRVERSLQRAWGKGAASIDEEFERSIIAIVNTYRGFSPENDRLRQAWKVARGGVIAVVKDGDAIHIDLATRKLDLDVSETEIQARWSAYVAPEPRIKRGYLKFYSEHVAPASEGAVMPRF